MADDDRFEPQSVRIGSADGGAAFRSVLFERIARASNGRGIRTTARRPSGRYNSRGRGAKLRHLTPSTDWAVDLTSGIRVRSRRVIVRARIVKIAGAKSLAAGRAHLRYLERDGASRDGERGRTYSTFTDEADGKDFLKRGEYDRHQFRFIVSPEDGPALDTLRSFTRELMATMEQDLGSILDWVAVDHFDTGHPHTHVLLRGRTEDGKILYIAGDYISQGIRCRASEIMSRWLGPQSELELGERLAYEVSAERLTNLDRDMVGRAEKGVVDLSQRTGWDCDDSYQQVLISRARMLERMGLAEREGGLTWRLAPDLETTLNDLGRRDEIIQAIHQALMAANLDRRPELFVIGNAALEGTPLIGRLVQHGVEGGRDDRGFLIIDGIDGCSHYVETGRNACDLHPGSIVRIEFLRAGPQQADQTVDRVAQASPLNVQSLSIHPLEEEAAIRAPSWLDHHLRSEEIVVANHGFGGEVRRALHRRLQWLIEQGLVTRRGDDFFCRGDMEERLRRSELAETVTRLSKELGLDFAEVGSGEPIAGALRRRIDLKSGQFALIENSREFMLVPWQPVLERYIGRELSGIARGSGSISWRIGPERQGPEIGM